jgi:hypothetical protein
MGVITFGGGATLEAMGDAETLTRNLGQVAGGRQVSVQGRALPAGFVQVQTHDGPVYVNPLQVAYVRDEAEMPQAESSDRERFSDLASG